jgi:hypothetical protein
MDEFTLTHTHTFEVIVETKTDAYAWKQTLEEVTVTIDVDVGTRGKDCDVKIDATHLRVRVKSKVVIDGELAHGVKSSESTWTIEDRKQLIIILQKRIRHESWESLLAGQNVVDAFTKEKMDKQMMLEKFQSENPGFDFSGAEFNGSLPANPSTFMDEIRN